MRLESVDNDKRLKVLERTFDPYDFLFNSKDGPTIGYATTTGHHGELLQGSFYGKDAKVHHALVTLPCQLFKTEAIFNPIKDSIVNVQNSLEMKKSKEAAILTLKYLGLKSWGGELQVTTNIQRDLGLGSSTSDVISTILAVANSFRCNLSPEEVSQLSVRAEQASDPLIYDNRAILFAHREGMIIEDFSGYLPALEIVGFNSRKNGGGIRTLSLEPICYDWYEIEEFRVLLGLIRKAIYEQDSSLIARVASSSARINQRYLKKENFSQYEELVKNSGALGFQVAHSGTVMGIIFDPNDTCLKQKITQVESTLLQMGHQEIWQFNSHKIEQDYEV